MPAMLLRLFSFFTGGGFSSIIKKVFSFLWKYKNIVGVVILAGVFFIGYMMIQNLQEDKVQLQNDMENLNQKYEQSIQNFNELDKKFENFTIKVQRDLQEQNEIITNIEDVRDVNEERYSELYDTFNISADGSERDLHEIINEKPELLENKINEGTQDVGDAFEELSR